MSSYSTPAPYSRTSLPHPHPASLPSQRLLLAWQPGPAETAYTICSAWAETVAGASRRTRLTRSLSLGVAAGLPAAPLRLTLRTLAPPRLQPTPVAFDALAPRLAALYAELVLVAAPTGQLLGLANQAASRQTWATLRQELLRDYAAPSEVMAELLAGIDEQLADPAGLGPSLAYDYAYAALLGDFYQQPFDTNHQYQRARVFPEFLGGLALHFTETLRLDPAADPAPTQVGLRLRGTLDRAVTDVAAIASIIQARLGLAQALDPADLSARYQATHRLDADTGRPVVVELSVRCAYRDQYEKEYHLTIQPQPTP